MICQYFPAKWQQIGNFRVLLRIVHPIEKNLAVIYIEKNRFFAFAIFALRQKQQKKAFDRDFGIKQFYLHGH